MSQQSFTAFDFYIHSVRARMFQTADLHTDSYHYTCMLCSMAGRATIAFPIPRSKGEKIESKKIKKEIKIPCSFQNVQIFSYLAN
jgi:hypothetical protein